MKNWRNMTCTCIAVALAFAALPALADIPSAVVTIHDESGKEVPDITVSMRDASGESIKLNPAPGGIYMVSSAEGKATLEIEHPVLGTMAVDLVLPAQKGLIAIELTNGQAHLVAPQNALAEHFEASKGVKAATPAAPAGSLLAQAAQYLVGPGTGADDCTMADAISGDGVYSFDNVGATTDGLPDPACLFFGSDQINSDVWFCWTADCDASVTVETCGGTGLDTKLAVYDGCACPTGAPLVCNDDSCGLQSSVTFAAIGGNSYLIRVGSFSAVTQGSGTFTITSTPGCGGGGGTGADDCAMADAISGDGVYSFDNNGATTDGLPDPACLFFGSDQINSDVWFCWTADCDASVTVETCGGTGLDTKLAVYDGCACPTGAPLACNDDSCGLQSSVTFAAIGGNSYLIRVGSFSAVTQGSGTFTVTSTPGCGGGGGPGDDSCAGADAISGTGVFPFDNTTATTDGLPDGLCLAFGTDQIDNDVWFCWTSNCDDNVSVSTVGLTGVDTRIAVYDGCACPTGSGILACNDDSAGTLQSTVTFDATSGNTYLIRIGVFPGALGGTGSFSISCVAPPMTICTEPPANCQAYDTNNAFNSTVGLFSCADDFTPTANGSVTSICWWGAYLPASPTPFPDSFTVTYYDDAGGFPGSVIGGPFVQGAGLTVGGPVDTGDTIIGIAPIWEYTGTHAAVAVTAGECYWLEIKNASGGGSSWFWEQSFGLNGQFVQDATPGDPYTGGDIVMGNDLAFCLNLALGDATICLPPPAMNDDCANATPISGVGVYPFDNSAATTDGLPDALCLSFGTDQIDNDVWFCWTSDCDDNVLVSTVGLTGVDTRIAVYDGCACLTGSGILACNDDALGTLQSQVSFDATSGNTYLIRIGVFPGAAGGLGSFEISCVAPPMEICFQPPANCQDYDTANALNSTDGQFVCQDDFTPAANGSITDICWWGAYLPALASDSFTVTYYADAGGVPGAVIGGPFTGGSLTVMGPEDTGDLVAGIAPIYEYTGTHAAVGVSAGQCYWIEIKNLPGAGASWFWEQSLGGNGRCLQSGAPVLGIDLAFCLNLALGDAANCLPPPPPGDFCEDAIGPLAVPSVTAGTTDGSTIDTGFPSPCGTGSITSPGVWYTVVGTGNTMTASTCNGNTLYDDKINVYCAVDCNDPASATCITGIDDFCGLQAEVSWCSQPGALYYILVHGFGGATGPFELVLSDDGTPCAGAIQCVALGACCLADGTCLDNLTQLDCEAQGGTYQGDETTCAGGFAGYVINDCADAFEDISGTGTPLGLTDDSGSVQPIGFTFNFFGVNQTTIGVCSNGYMTFGPTLTDFTNDPIPSTFTPNDLIAPLWDDFNPGAGGQVYVQTLGVAPNRRFIAQWDGVPQFGNTDSNTFQAILFEGSNSISFRYANITPEAFAGDYSVGVEDATGSVGASVPGNTIANGDCLLVTANLVPPIECPVEVVCDDCPPGTNPLVDGDGDNSGWCWSTNRPNHVDIFVDNVVPGSHALIEISKDFTGTESQFGLMPAILIDFFQICEDDATVNMIRIADESITNLTSEDWTDFHWILFDGPEAWFDVAASSGFTVFPPFTMKMFEDFIDDPVNNKAKRLSAFGGVVPRFSSFFPGDGAGDLKIGIDLSGENPVSFTLKEVPTTDSVGFLNVNGGLVGSHVAVWPQDIFEATDGMGEFVRFYMTGTDVSLTAEPSVDGRAFLRWVVDGVNQPTWVRTIVVDVDAASTVNAVYRGTTGRIDVPVVPGQ